MKVERASARHIEQWASLRAELWPEYSIDYHRRDASRLYLSNGDRTAAFVCLTEDGVVVAFSEVSLRGDFVNGCDTSPVLFLEGIFVHRDQRMRGVARLLCEAAADWGRSKGCSEFASDALLDNAEGHDFHEALGFAETERVVYFRKSL